MDGDDTTQDPNPSTPPTATQAPPPPPQIDYGVLKQALRDVLAEEVGEPPELARRFQGGTVEIRPGDAELQSRTLPVEELFKKVVRVRDQLRLLEQKINANKELASDDRKVLQGYLTRAYGSLTSFNFLFQDKDDYFVGAKGK